MNNKFPIKERILKIFTPVRCLNRDQLPRYIDGKMTAIEKHLVEEHLVACDLCYTAMQTLEKAANREPYESLTTNTISYIHQHYLPAPRDVVKQQAIRKGRKQESLLAYFWTLAIIGFIGGGIYVVQAAIKHRGMKAANISSIPVAVPETVSQTDGDARYATLNSTGQPTAETPPTTTQHAVAVTRDTTKQLNLKKDSVKILAAAQTTALPKRDSATSPAPRKTVAKDSVAHPAPAPVNEKKPEPAKTEATPTPKEKEKEKEEPSSKSVNIDESLYKSAMMLQQQGSLDQAIERYKKVSPGSRFGELARYQMAVCYKNRGQSGKARKLFKEVVRMDGSMKVAAENALKD